MKVLLDECVDWRLGRDIVGHDVKTARLMGWAAIKNGELLALAEQQFDVFVTVDRNLSFQQNLHRPWRAICDFVRYCGREARERRSCRRSFVHPEA